MPGTTSSWLRCVAAAGLILTFCEPAFPNGGKAKKTLLEARVTSGQGKWLFSSEIVPIQYRLNTIRNKYKLIQIRIQNQGGKTLQLSRTADTVEVKLGSDMVPAIIDISARDPEFWDSLDADLRTVLAYPPAVESGEEESVFLFVPRTDTKDVPQSLQYKIASTDAPILLRAPVAAAKR